MEAAFKNLLTLWKLYNLASNLLVDALGGTANSEVGEFAEQLVAKHYNAKQLPTSNKSADLETPDGKFIQVKSRRLDSLKSESLGVFRSWDFDTLVVVLFSKDGNILKAFEIDKDIAEKMAKPNGHQNGQILITSNELLEHKSATDITVALRQILDSNTICSE